MSFSFHSFPTSDIYHWLLQRPAANITGLVADNAAAAGQITGLVADNAAATGQSTGLVADFAAAAGQITGLVADHAAAAGQITAPNQGGSGLMGRGGLAMAVGWVGFR